MVQDQTTLGITTLNRATLGRATLGRAALVRTALSRTALGRAERPTAPPGREGSGGGIRCAIRQRSDLTAADANRRLRPPPAAAVPGRPRSRGWRSGWDWGGPGLRLALALWAAALWPGPAHASLVGLDTVQGPVLAEAWGVIDGATLEVTAHIWLNQSVVTNVGLAGVNVPMLSAACARERQLAVEAREFLKTLLGNGAVNLLDIRNGLYAGRVVATVINSASRDLSEEMLRAGLATRDPSDKSWCNGD